MAYTPIDKSDDYFNTVLYTGDGTNSNAITGVGFQPDWVWCKDRSAVKFHMLADVVRGTGLALFSNATNADNSANNLMSFDSDGFTLGNDNTANTVGDSCVAWNWKAGGTAVSNTAGATTTSVSANTTSDFSIVSWTGTAGNTTIGHGLGTVPSCIIAKNRDKSDSNWVVWHKNLTSGYFLKLNLTNAQDNANAYFTSNPTSSLINLSGGGAFNGSGDAMIAYCFAEKKGFSKFGSYTGNGSADGTFVYTGFKPAWLMVKRSDAPEYWNILDTARADVPNANPTDQALYANDASAEFSETQGIDLVSNGFKVREGGAGWCNASGGTYIYMAFAENPLVTSGGTPTTAR